MNIRMGSQVYRDVQIPLLWGERAIIVDELGRLSVIDLSGERAQVEVLSDEPAPGIGFRPLLDGIVILKDGTELYSYNPSEKAISSLSLGLPDIQISVGGTRVGTNWFSGNVFVGSGVGLSVSKDGISLAAPLPSKLARLAI
jgi:hypothetical protein